jgi:hypothetical protein
MRLSIAKKDFAISISELQKSVNDSTKLAFCSFPEKKESLYRGYSSVGIIANFFDLNGELVVRAKVNNSIADCKD